MIGYLKGIVRRNLNSSRFPAAMEFYYRRDMRKMQTLQDRHSSMTYAEIEAEISSEYEKTFGRKIDWDNPQTYSEKVRVSNLYMPTPEKTRLVDKLLVRDWIREKIGAEYSVPLLGVYEKFDDINFGGLPNEFVIKCNHDCGSYSIVKDKSKMDIEPLRRKYDVCMKRNYAWGWWEMAYHDIKPKIMIEKYIDIAKMYHFFCFQGEPRFSRIDFDRFRMNKQIYYDMNCEPEPFNIGHAEYFPRPKEFEDVKKLACILAKGIDMARIGFYISGGKIFFEEIEFTSAPNLNSDEWDYKFGALWPFDNSVRKKILAEKSRP